MSRHQVIRSIETDDGWRCVDIFVRGDGSFGFEEYRKDAEDPRGWFAVGGYGGARFASAGAALADAVRCVAWLGEIRR